MAQHSAVRRVCRFRAKCHCRSRTDHRAKSAVWPSHRRKAHRSTGLFPQPNLRSRKGLTDTAVRMTP